MILGEDRKAVVGVEVLRKKYENARALLAM